MRPVPLAVIVLLGAVALGACTSKGRDTSDPSYRAGYADGCATASSSGAGVPRRIYRDDLAYEVNPAYRRGWRAGSNECNPARRTGDDL